jgi:hypothetical protein
MSDKERRKRVATCVGSLDQRRLQEIGNWVDVEALGPPAQLNSIDIDDDEIFEIAPERFECLATLYVTLVSEDVHFEETLLATFRGSITDQAVSVESAEIDAEALAGETVAEQ